MPPTVYLLENSFGRTYVGCTIHGVERRMKQHNGDLSGGARQTERGRPWSLYCTISGFRTRQESLQFEYAWRRVHRHQRPRPSYNVDGRVKSLNVLMAKERWSRNAPLAKDVPLSILYAKNMQVQSNEQTTIQSSESQGILKGENS